MRELTVNFRIFLPLKLMMFFSYYYDHTDEIEKDIRESLTETTFRHERS